MYPSDANFKMPPEWAKHSRTLMAWPVIEALWPEPFNDILPAYANIVNTIARFEPVGLVVKPELLKEAEAYCSTNVELIPLANDDSWMRDSGPTFISNSAGELAGINWIFNAWGGKYAYDLDNQLAPELLKHYGIPCLDVPLVMEGGSIHVDGEGTLLTTEECLLNPNRNLKLNRAEIETYLQRYLNISKIIWLKRGWDGDDTDGHVDNVACFACPGVILAQVCSDPSDPNYEISQENLTIIKKATDAQGRKFEVITIEQPPAHFYQEVRLTLSYLNFYFVNGGIVLPVFGGAATQTDANAISILKKVFPDRKIAPVDGLTIARGGGNVHCLTQQMPIGTPAKGVLFKP
ncbi:MAG TPA: agmatine deiminase family protein [Bacillota bacterium]|nr:agmatine deiminase family protein [Bacillota bacterium]